MKTVIELYRDWRDAVALVAELQQAVKIVDRSYYPPKVSPLWVDDCDATRSEECAARRLRAGKSLERQARVLLLCALNDCPINED